MCAERTARAVLESRTGCNGFWLTSTLSRDPFLSDTPDLKTVELMILHLRDSANSDFLI